MPYPHTTQTRITPQITTSVPQTSHLLSTTALHTEGEVFSSGPKPSKRLTLEEGQRILAIDWYYCYQSLAAGEDCEPPE